MARTLIAYFCLLCVVEICRSHRDVRRYYPAHNKQKLNLRQGDSGASEVPDQKPSQTSGNSSTYYYTTKKVEVVYDHCLCSQVYDPICASNDKSYFNHCQMECEVGRDSNVTVRHQGNCIPF